MVAEQGVSNLSDRYDAPSGYRLAPTTVLAEGHTEYETAFPANVKDYTHKQAEFEGLL